LANDPVAGLAAFGAFAFTAGFVAAALTAGLAAGRGAGLTGVVLAAGGVDGVLALSAATAAGRLVWTLSMAGVVGVFGRVLTIFPLKINQSSLSNCLFMQHK